MAVKKVPSGKSVNSYRNPKQMFSAKIQVALYQIADAASAVTDMQSFYKRLHEIVGSLMYAENFFIALHDPHTDLITWPYYVDTVDIEQPEPIALKEQHGGTGWILRTGRTLSHAEGTVSYIIEHGEAEQTGTVSDAIGVPLNSDGKTMGVLLIQSYRDEIKYNLEHVGIMNFVAQHISIALTRARAIEETRQRNSELAILNSVGEAMARTLDVKTVTKIVGDKVRDIFSADQMGILLFESQTNLIHILYGYDKAHHRYVDSLQIKPIPLGKGLTSKVIELRRPLLLRTREEQDGYGHYMPPELAGQIKMSESWLGTPIMVNENVMGVVFVEDYRPHAYDETHLRLLQTLSSNMGVAIQNARLFEEAQRLLKETEDRAAELAIINSVQAGLASKLDMQGIYDLVGDKVREIFDANTVTLATFDLDKNLMSPRYVFEKGQRFSIEPLPIPKVYGEFIQRSQPLLINSNIAEYIQRLDPNTKPLAGEIPKSVLAVPLITSGELRGIVSLQNIDRENAFGDSDVRLLQTLANSMSVALENARLFDETQRLLKETEQRNAELAVINSIQAGLANKLEMQAIYNLIGESIRDIFKAETVAINHYDQEHDLISTPYLWSRGIRLSNEEPTPLSDSPLRKAMIDSRESWMINQEAENIPKSLSANPDEQLGRWPKSGIGASIVAMDKVIGIIQILNMEQENTYTNADLHLLETISNSMSVALENARLWEQEKMYRKALQRELDIGREIQLGFLPETLPVVDGWEIAASLMSAREVAGDFYDAFELPDGSIGLVIADVCDKGVGAALFMTLFRSLIRAAANLDYFEQTDQANAPHTAVERLQRAVSLTNNYIAETHGESGMFATIFFGILDPREGRLIYINAGHEAPLIVRTGAVREPLRKSGPAVGALVNARFQILETQIRPGDTFFAFTDGVPDCQNSRGEFFGRERLLDLLQGNNSAHELVDEIASDLQQYIASANQFDDITLLAVKRSMK